MPIDWPVPLKHRRGSSKRLGGVDIYYDFDWRQVFEHNRSAFPNGQSLSTLVARDCPEDKTPTLLLTVQGGVSPEIRELEDRYIVIVPILEYLESAGADAASTYYARLAGTPLTRLSSLGDVSFTATELSRFLEENLSEAVLEGWAAESPERVETLRRVTDRSDGSHVSDLPTVLRGMETLDAEILDAVVDYVDRTSSSEGHQELLALLAASASGRRAMLDALGARLPDRIQDVREEIGEYNNLIATPDVTESEVQRFLESAPWIVGLPYIRARARVEIPRGELDFVLDRHDGFFDILELKGPDDAILTRSGSATERPASASAHSLGPALAKALAQAHTYRSILQAARPLGVQYGLSDTRDPRVFIVVGRASDLDEHQSEILRQLNLSLHRVEIVPYDLLGQRTLGLLDNLERLLGEDEAATGVVDSDSTARVDGGPDYV